VSYNKFETIANIDDNWKKLTVIIPVRFSSSRGVIKRLDYLLKDNELDKHRKNINFIIVDDGSSLKERTLIQEKSKHLDLGYLFINSTDKPFSISRARNLGAIHARSTYIMFMDVDLVPYDGFYGELLSEIEIQNLEKFANDFIMISVIYLTEKGGSEFLRIDSHLRKNKAINWLLLDNTNVIEKFSSGTSVCLYNRDIYLGLGGCDEAFEEWGFEDLEFNLRMIRAANKFSFPKAICDDYKNFSSIVEYKGWKSMYRLFGDITFQKGIVLFHIWHKVDKQSSYIRNGREKNRKLFQERCENFHKKQIKLPPLPDIHEGNTLLFSKTNPFIWNTGTLAKFGVIHFQEECSFTAESLLNYIKDHLIDRVLFHNPYASEHRQHLYNTIRSNNIPYMVAERGALRESIFFDSNGFNAESSSYDSKNWDKPLPKDGYNLVESYIGSEKKISTSLEKQTPRKNLNSLRLDLNIPLGNKILFIPLQRPSDTVIEYFCGDIESYNNFIKLVKKVVKKLPLNWSVIVKKHPLEDDCPDVGEVQFSNANIKDLIELSDYVLLINSGVGVLSLLWGKPVMYAGDVFYGDDRINKKVATYQDVLSLLNLGFKLDNETAYRFLYFLIAKFYSFGKFTTIEAPWKGNGRMTVTKDIDFYQIRNIGRQDLNMYVGMTPRISDSSILFDRYRGLGIESSSRDTDYNDYILKMKRETSLVQKLGGRIFGLLVSPYLSSYHKTLLKNNPKLFFGAAKHPFSVWVGKLLKLR